LALASRVKHQGARTAGRRVALRGADFSACGDTQDDLIYRDELERVSGNGLTVVYTLTDSQPPGWTSYARRVDPEMLAEVAPGPGEQPRFFTCGPTPFVEAVAEALVRLGHETEAIKTERFGPTRG
jgi:ferredoxin-NADP reductase